MSVSFPLSVIGETKVK